MESLLMVGLAAVLCLVLFTRSWADPTSADSIIQTIKIPSNFDSNDGFRFDADEAKALELEVREGKTDRNTLVEQMTDSQEKDKLSDEEFRAYMTKAKRYQILTDVIEEGEKKMSLLLPYTPRTPEIRQHNSAQRRYMLEGLKGLDTHEQKIYTTDPVEDRQNLKGFPQAKDQDGPGFVIGGRDENGVPLIHAYDAFTRVPLVRTDPKDPRYNPWMAAGRSNPFRYHHGRFGGRTCRPPSGGAQA